MKRNKEKVRQAKAHRMENPGAKSKYSRKKTWCHINKTWGFNVPHPKPWK